MGRTVPRSGGRDEDEREARFGEEEEDEEDKRREESGVVMFESRGKLELRVVVMLKCIMSCAVHALARCLGVQECTSSATVSARVWHRLWRRVKTSEASLIVLLEMRFFHRFLASRPEHTLSTSYIHLLA